MDSLSGQRRALEIGEQQEQRHEDTNLQSRPEHRVELVGTEYVPGTVLSSSPVLTWYSQQSMIWALISPLSYGCER